MAQAYQIDYPEFQKKLVASLRKAWQEIRSKRRQEGFYLFGIETDSDITDHPVTDGGRMAPGQREDPQTVANPGSARTR